MKALFLRVFFIAIVVLLAMSCVRVTFGIEEPLTFSGLLNALETIDFSFSSTYRTIVDVVNAFSSISVGGWDAVLDVLKAIVQIITLPLDIVIDLFTTVASCFAFVAKLFGFMP